MRACSSRRPSQAFRPTVTRWSSGPIHCKPTEPSRRPSIENAQKVALNTKHRHAPECTSRASVRATKQPCSTMESRKPHRRTSIGEVPAIRWVESAASTASPFACQPTSKLKERMQKTISRHCRRQSLGQSLTTSLLDYGSDHSETYGDHHDQDEDPSRDCSGWHTATKQETSRPFCRGLDATLVPNDSSCQGMKSPRSHERMKNDEKHGNRDAQLKSPSSATKTMVLVSSKAPYLMTKKQAKRRASIL